MTAVLISIRPKWCELIARGKKTVEIRKTKPRIETPFKVYIYCTKTKVFGEILLTYDKKVEGRNKGFRNNGDIPIAGKIIGEFVCDRIIESSGVYGDELSKVCCNYEYVQLYGNGRYLYGWHISDLVIYDEPKDLGEFQVKAPPQSWRYVERIEAENA